VVGQNPPPAVRALAKDPSNLRDRIRGGRASVCCPCFSCKSLLRIGNGNKKQGLGGDGHGKACGHTSIGVRGINATHGDHLCIADSPLKFADHVEALLLDKPKRRRIGHQARRICDEAPFLGTRNRQDRDDLSRSAKQVTYAALPVDADWEPKKQYLPIPLMASLELRGEWHSAVSGKQLARRDEAPVSFRCAKATSRAASGHVSFINRAPPKKMGECAALHVA